MTLKFQQDEGSLILAAGNIGTRLPAVSAIPSFAEKYYRWELEQKARFVRQQQKFSRKIKKDLTNNGTIGQNKGVGKHWTPAKETENGANE